MLELSESVVQRALNIDFTVYTSDDASTSQSPYSCFKKGRGSRISRKKAMTENGIAIWDFGNSIKREFKTKSFSGYIYFVEICVPTVYIFTYMHVYKHVFQYMCIFTQRYIIEAINFI